MADTSTITAEPEETLESLIVSSLSSSSALPVEGVLTPSSSGTVKSLSADSFIGVRVDLASQDGDYTHLAPFTFNVQVLVRVSAADDPTRTIFRDECRRVRAVLLTFAGDGCSSLSSTTFACDEFILGSTSTDCEAGDNPISTKAYSATLKGRIINS